MTKTFFILIACLFLTKSTQAQEIYGFAEGQIIKKQGDTIKCLVSMTTSYGDVVKYKMKSNSPEITIKSSEVKLLKTPYNTFENISFGEKERLMTVMLVGKVTLYSCMFFYNPQTNYYKDNTAITTYSKDITYLIKKDDTINEIKNKNFKNLMTSIMSDCETVISKINNKVYKFKNLETVVEEYNKCK